jgi:serpin B
MVYAGAKAGTADEISKTLHLQNLVPANGGDLLGAYLKDFFAQPALGDTELDGSKFETANALWGANHYDFQPTYISIIKTDFSGDLRRVNFGNTTAASNKINSWVAFQTHGNIPSIVSPLMLNKYTRLILTNAVYFKGGWAQPFYPGNTQKAPFYVTPSDEVRGATMDMTSIFGYAEDDSVQMLVLDYRYGDTSMIIVLPKAKDGLPALEADLTLSKLSTLLATIRPSLVHVTLPKFSADNTFDMIPALKTLGLRQVFDPKQSNLTGIAIDPSRPLYVNFIIHKAHLDVDEVGTEVAAATAIGVAVAASAPAPQQGPPPVPIPFIANHPFLYFIRDNANGQILFMGRIEDPTI